MSETFDILGVGCVAVDDLLYVEAYPPADAKTQVKRAERQCGGLTATALVAAARLGARCAFANTLGGDELSRFALDRLRAEGIDVSHVARHASARPIHSVIVVDETNKTRNVFSNRAAYLESPAMPLDEELVRRSRVLLVDHVAPARQLDAAGVASKHGIPIVADFERDDAPGAEELLRLVDHLIVSRVFACRRTGERDAARACESLRRSHSTVVVTDGARGSWYLGPSDSSPLHQAAAEVHVVDTTGCGDVFHGAYALALRRGVPLSERVLRATSAAGLKATRPGGQAGCPTGAELDQFLRTVLP